MLMRMAKLTKMSYLNIQNRSQCSFGCALEVHLTLLLKFGESNAMGSALNTWQMPQTVR